MSEDTLRRMRGSTVRQRRLAPPTRDMRRRPLPAKHGHAARPQATRAYQSDTSSKQRPCSSISPRSGAGSPRPPPVLLDNRSLHISAAEQPRHAGRGSVCLQRSEAAGKSRAHRPAGSRTSLPEKPLATARTPLGKSPKTQAGQGKTPLQDAPGRNSGGSAYSTRKRRKFRRREVRIGRQTGQEGRPGGRERRRGQSGDRAPEPW